MYKKIKCNVLHVGLSKCASSFFQRYVFTNDNGYLLLRNKQHRQQIKKLRNGCITYDREEFKNSFQKDIDEVRDNKKIIISHESLSGFPENTLNLEFITREIGEVFEPDYVMVIIRNPIDYIYSIWSNYVRLGGSLSLKQFLYHPSSPSRFNHQNSLIYRLDYDLYINKLKNQFGAKVKVYLMEDFVNSPEKFFSDLSRGSNIDFTPGNMGNKPQSSLGLTANRIIGVVNVLFSSKKCKTPVSILPFHSSFRNFIESRFKKNEEDRAKIRKYILSLLKEEDIMYINNSVSKLEGTLDRDLNYYKIDICNEQ